ncbi:MAG: hypothetical protein K9I68_11530 [Bacteroidales bacterium]|nr:hypothetical protein [Bacteroidales bacterium]MCF8339260.1 hypothetical protein [Bacteroidales bacterium]
MKNESCLSHRTRSLNNYYQNSEGKVAEIILKNLNGITIFADEINLKNSNYLLNHEETGLTKG